MGRRCLLPTEVLAPEGIRRRGSLASYTRGLASAGGSDRLLSPGHGCSLGHDPAPRTAGETKGKTKIFVCNVLGNVSRDNSTPLPVCFPRNFACGHVWVSGGAVRRPHPTESELLSSGKEGGVWEENWPVCGEPCGAGAASPPRDGEGGTERGRCPPTLARPQAAPCNRTAASPPRPWLPPSQGATRSHCAVGSGSARVGQRTEVLCDQRGGLVRAARGAWGFLVCLFTGRVS